MQLKQDLQAIGQNKIRQGDLVIKNGKLYIVLTMKKAYCLIKELETDKLLTSRVEELKYLC
jgi:hypothetical protein